MQKILYLHAGAEMYGADKVLLELIKGLDKEAFEAHVILPNDGDRKSTRLNSSHLKLSRMPSSA